jgi:hypothetical protein
LLYFPSRFAIAIPSRWRSRSSSRSNCAKGPITFGIECGTLHVVAHYLAASRRLRHADCICALRLILSMTMMICITSRFHPATHSRPAHGVVCLESPLHRPGYACSPSHRPSRRSMKRAHLGHPRPLQQRHSRTAFYGLAGLGIAYVPFSPLGGFTTFAILGTRVCGSLL